jgi:hypothetical protein
MCDRRMLMLMEICSILVEWVVFFLDCVVQGVWEERVLRAALEFRALWDGWDMEIWEGFVKNDAYATCLLADHWLGAMC